MRRTQITVAALAVAAAGTIGGVALAAGGSGSAYPRAANTTITSHTGTTTMIKGTTVQTATATVQGHRETILVDAKGLPLYIFEADTATTSRVTGQLAVLWPPLLSNAPTESGAAGRLNSVATQNGNQVAYNGHFLYTFIQDSPGHVTGQGVQNFFVATPTLSDLAGSSTSSATSPSTSTYESY